MMNLKWWIPTPNAPRRKRKAKREPKSSNGTDTKGTIRQYLTIDRHFSMKRKADDDMDDCENDGSGGMDGMMGGQPKKSKFGPKDLAQIQIGESKSETRKSLKKTDSVGMKPKSKLRIKQSSKGSIKEFFNCLEMNSHGSCRNDSKKGGQKQKPSVYLLTNIFVKFMNRSNKDEID